MPYAPRGYGVDSPHGINWTSRYRPQLVLVGKVMLHGELNNFFTKPERFLNTRPLSYCRSMAFHSIP